MYLSPALAAPTVLRSSHEHSHLLSTGQQELQTPPAKYTLAAAPVATAIPGYRPERLWHIVRQSAAGHDCSRLPAVTLSHRRPSAKVGRRPASKSFAARLTILLLATALAASASLTATTLTGCRPAPPPPVAADPTPPGPAPEPGQAGPPDSRPPANGALAALVVTTYPHDLGRAELKDPDLRTLVRLPGLGYAPPDQVWLLLADGYDRAAAAAIAVAWGANLVGEIEIISAYQLETTDTTLEQLLVRLDEATAHPTSPPLCLTCSYRSTSVRA